MLELNNRLESQPELLKSDPHGTGYVAVVYPDTELPDFHNFESWKLKERLKSENKFKDGMCFAWITGSCKRGSECKFTHVDLSSLSGHPDSGTEEGKNKKARDSNSEKIVQ